MTLEESIVRLEQAADRLRGGQLTAAEAAEVVDQCARTAAEASAELERLVRAAASDADPARPSPPGQDQLL